MGARSCRRDGAPLTHRIKVQLAIMAKHLWQLHAQRPQASAVLNYNVRGSFAQKSERTRFKEQNNILTATQNLHSIGPDGHRASGSCML
eukprot:1965383-Amphidinium_carterae.1